MNWVIPKRLKICDIRVGVVKTKHLAADESQYGRSHSFLKKIELDSNMSEQDNKNTFLHEWLHQVSDVFKLKLSEQTTSILAVNLHQMMGQLDVDR